MRHFTQKTNKYSTAYAFALNHMRAYYEMKTMKSRNCLETGQKDRTNEAPLLYALLLGMTMDYVNTINRIGLFATVDIENKILPFNENEKLREDITQLLKMIELCVNNQVTSNNEVSDIVELLQGAGTTKLGLDNEGITGQKYATLFCKYLFDATAKDEGRRCTALQLLLLFAFARETNEVNLRHYEEGDAYELTAMGQMPLSGSSSVFRIAMKRDELTSFDRPTDKLITVYEMALLLFGKDSVPGFDTKKHSLAEAVKRAVRTAIDTSFTLNITEADTNSSGQQKKKSPTKAKNDEREKAGMCINGALVVMKQVLDNNNLDQDEIESDANEGEEEEQEDDAGQYSTSQTLARIRGLVDEASRHVRHILPKTYDPENCLFLEQLEAEYEKVGHYKYSSEDDEESMDVGEPLDKSELSEHLRQTCDAKESEKTTQLNYLMKISTDDDEDAIAFTGAWKEEEPDNFFPESGAEENRTWNEWMRFANRAKQTWNMKELKSKISSRKTLLLYAKNCRISTHLKEKLDNEDVNEYGNEVYDIYKKEQDEIKEQTNGSKKRGATIENEGENDNKTKRQKSP